jgi:hypothetical protein
MLRTTTDISANKWGITDEPFRIRRWGGGYDDTYEFPHDISQAITVGRHPACDIVLDDARVSKRHAQIYFRDGHWRIRDLGTRNGIIVDGVRLWRSEENERDPRSFEEVPLLPGMLIELGGVTWIVESHKLVDLRSFLARLVGYATSKLAEVDYAIRAVRRAAMGHEPLLLMGRGDLVGVSRLLHRRVLGESKPFVVCDRDRVTTAATVRSGANYEHAVLALPAARGGTLCVPHDRTPDDMPLILTAHREPNARFLLVLVESGDLPKPNQLIPILVPPVHERRNELNTVIQGYADDARARYQIATALQEADRAWIARNAAESHPELEKTAERVIALRGNDGNMSTAATMLGMSSSALGRWFKERKPLPALERCSAPSRRRS